MREVNILEVKLEFELGRLGSETASAVVVVATVVAVIGAGSRCR